LAGTGERIAGVFRARVPVVAGDKRSRLTSTIDALANPGTGVAVVTAELGIFHIRIVDLAPQGRVRAVAVLLADVLGATVLVVTVSVNLAARLHVGVHACVALAGVLRTRVTVIAIGADIATPLLGLVNAIQPQEAQVLGTDVRVVAVGRGLTAWEDRLGRAGPARAGVGGAQVLIVALRVLDAAASDRHVITRAVFVAQGVFAARRVIAVARREAASADRVIGASAPLARVGGAGVVVIAVARREAAPR